MQRSREDRETKKDKKKKQKQDAAAKAPEVEDSSEDSDAEVLGAKPGKGAADKHPRKPKDNRKGTVTEEAASEASSQENAPASFCSLWVQACPDSLPLSPSKHLLSVECRFLRLNGSLWARRFPQATEAPQEDAS